MAISTGTMKYLTTTSGSNSPGLYYYDGSNYQKIVISSDLNTGVVPINLAASSPITLSWNSSTNTLTIGHS